MGHVLWVSVKYFCNYRMSDQQSMRQACTNAQTGQSFLVHGYIDPKLNIEPWKIVVCERIRNDLIVLRISCCCKCSVTLPHGAVGWSALCDCGIS